MIRIFETFDKNLNEIEAKFNGGLNLRNKWLHLENPTDLEIELIERISGVEEDTLKAALDEDERSRIALEDGNLLVIFDVPVIEDEESYYSYNTVPMGVVITKHCIITVCLEANAITRNLMTQRVKDLDTANRYKFLYQMFYITSTKYLQYLRQIDRSYQRLQAELKRSTKNKELIQMLDLENALVYFSTSLRGNGLVMERIAKISPKLDEETQELLEDAQIENRQALDMSNIYREVLSSTMDAWASIVSNNLNETMKLLTIVSILINIPMIYASFWGMNTYVPWQGKWWGFWIVIVLSILSVAVAWYGVQKSSRFGYERLEKKRKKLSAKKKKK